jgi:hypothetical protein
MSLIKKECLGDNMDIIPSGSDYACEDSSVSEYISSNELQHRYNSSAVAGLYVACHDSIIYNA